MMMISLMVEDLQKEVTMYHAAQVTTGDPGGTTAIHRKIVEIRQALLKLDKALH